MSLQEMMETAEKYGFLPDAKSGFLKHEREDSNYGEVDYLIFKEDSVLFKIESYGTFPDGDGGWDDGYDKTYSAPGQSLEDFLKDW